VWPVGCDTLLVWLPGPSGHQETQTAETIQRFYTKTVANILLILLKFSILQRISIDGAVTRMNPSMNLTTIML
jgi:hypothetical protein